MWYWNSLNGGGMKIIVQAMKKKQVMQLTSAQIVEQIKQQE